MDKTETRLEPRMSMPTAASLSHFFVNIFFEPSSFSQSGCHGASAPPARSDRTQPHVFTSQSSSSRSCLRIPHAVRFVPFQLSSLQVLVFLFSTCDPCQFDKLTRLSARFRFPIRLFLEFLVFTAYC